MKISTLNQWTIAESQDTNLQIWVEAFMFDRKAQGLSKGTICFYTKKLKLFCSFCESISINRLVEITPLYIRQYLNWLKERGHNPGGIHACFRALKTFLLWWENEYEPEDWKNPIRKVKTPKISIKPLKSIKLDSIQALIDTCDSSLLGSRDKALILCLLDTGVRAAELCDMNLEDLTTTCDSIHIINGKGGKPRSVFLGKRTRRVLRVYLRKRNDNSPALWITNTSNRITYWGLREIIRRRAAKANIPKPKLHDFRRTFALECLRNRVDVYSLQKMMGHSDLQVLQRYLAQTTEDIKAAHVIGSPVDNAW